MTEMADTGQKAAPGSWAEVLAVFLRLGLTSFGGPIADPGYFRGSITYSSDEML